MTLFVSVSGPLLKLYTQLLSPCETFLSYRIVSVSEMAQRRRLRSAAGYQLVVPSELMWPSGVFCTQSETMELFA